MRDLRDPQELGARLLAVRKMAPAAPLHAFHDEIEKLEAERMSAPERTIAAFLASLDQQHLNYAAAYADELAVGDPSTDGLDPNLVAKIQRMLKAEWLGQRGRQ